MGGFAKTLGPLEESWQQFQEDTGQKRHPQREQATASPEVGENNTNNDVDGGGGGGGGDDNDEEQEVPFSPVP